MKWRHTYKPHSTLKLLCFIAVLFSSVQGLAQFGNSRLQTSVLYDTLLANSNREILFNSITLTNVTNQPLNIIMTVTPPKGWSSITSKEQTITLEGNKTSIVPLRLAPSGSKTSTWQTVRIEYRINNDITELLDTFRVRVKEFSKFKANLLNSSTILASYQKNLTFPVYIKNMGNSIDNYTVRSSNDKLQLNERISFPLKPGTDTVYNLRLKISENQWDILRKEDIKVLVSSTDEETVNLSQGISRIGSTLKGNSTAFLDMPLSIQGGTMYQGAGTLQYYGGIRGYVNLSRYEKLAIDFRSNTYSQNNTINSSIIRAEYVSKNWDIMAGNVSELSDFFIDGYGGKLGYKWSKQTYIQGYGMLKSRIGDRKTGGLNIGYRLSDNASGTDQFSANIDNVNKVNAYTARQGFNLLLSDKGVLNIVAGAGMEQTQQPLVGNANQTLIGSTFGYNLKWGNEKFSVLSNVLLNSNSFPGIYKGQREQIHEARTLFKSSFAGVYFENTYRRQTLFIDTVLYKDVFNIQTNNYGLRYGNTFHNTNMIWSLGQQVQEQPFDLTSNRKFYFTYLNLNMAATFFKKLTITTNSYVGFGAIGEAFGKTTLINSNQSSLQYDKFGVSLRYDIGPYYYHEFLAYNNTPEKYRRLILSPYADFNFFDKSLNFRTQINYAKTVPNATEVLNMMGNIGYSNVMRGYDFHLSGIIPLKQQNANPYFNATFQLRLHVPFVPVREYYNLKLILFKDKNGDGKPDAGEEPIQDQTLSLGNSLFVTNEAGQVLYKNVSKGIYKGDFGYSSKIKGWIPVGGTIQSFEVSGNRTYFVPYKKSKVIQGKINVTLDENSNLTFSPANIKVTATTGQDSLVSYFTLTDENGEFYFNVPDGVYMVTLSPLAFDENFQPTQFSQTADMIHNDERTLYFEVRQKKRGINIRKK